MDFSPEEALAFMGWQAEHKMAKENLMTMDEQGGRKGYFSQGFVHVYHDRSKGRQGGSVH